MNFNRSIYARSLKLALCFVLTLAVGFGATVPQAIAYLGCDHVCCSIAGEPHMQHEVVQLAGPAGPACCAPAAGDACRLCDADGQPFFAMALHSATCGDAPTAGGIATEKSNLPPELVLLGRSSRKTVPANLAAIPLYLQTLTLLI